MNLAIDDYWSFETVATWAVHNPQGITVYDVCLAVDTIRADNQFRSLLIEVRGGLLLPRWGNELLELSCALREVSAKTSDPVPSADW